MHVIMLFPEVIPDVLTKSCINKCWGHGMVDIQHLSGGNIGRYFVAYLTDMEITEVAEAGKLGEVQDKDIKLVGKQSKAIIKGMRLGLYPAGVNIFRLSRGIKKPTVIKRKANGQPLRREDLWAFVPSAVTTEYDKAFMYTTDDGEHINTVRYTKYVDDIPDYIKYDIDILNELWCQEMEEEIERSRSDEYLL